MRSVGCFAAVLLFSLPVFSLPALAAPQTDPLAIASDAARDWYQPAHAKIQQKALVEKNRGRGKARNIILFVGDGMGISTVTAARIFAGQAMGQSGEEYQLAFDKFPYTGLSHTYNTNSQTPDSAGTMTALITGVKTKAGVLGVDDGVLRQRCDTLAGTELWSAIELAEIQGKATGIVTTARVTHATPAATFAHTPERNWEGDNELSASAREQGCEDIASQLISFESRLKNRLLNAGVKKARVNDIDGLEVVMGGGARYFYPQGEKDFGQRLDKRNLVSEWQSLYADGQFAQNSRQLDQAVAKAPTHLFGLFSSSHMAYDSERRAAKADSPVANEPSLPDMTAAAIDLLKTRKRGFFLMVEAGRIDHAHHAGNAYNALADTAALSAAVEVAVNKTSVDDTLIIITADHSHVLTMAGYPQRGNPILGKVIKPDDNGLPQDQYALDDNGRPYTTLGYMNGRGFADLKSRADADLRYQQPIDSGRKDLTDVDTTQPGYHQEALVGLGDETHGGEDVGIYGRGPGAYLVSGSHEQNVIFHVMDFAGGLRSGAEKALR